VPPVRGAYDSWLQQFARERLDPIEAAVAAGGRYELFRGLDDDLWAMLLSGEYECYPAIRALLPAMPEPALQEIWNGVSGMALLAQTNAFYRRLRASQAQHGGCALADATVLDFGCGWGRVTRFLARDVAPGSLFACDPVEGILEACRAARVPATLARSEFRPERLPFEKPFDLVFAFSVFTHLSEVAHDRCLAAIHRGLAPRGLLVATIRPPAYLSLCEAMHPLAGSIEDESAYLFVPHPAEPRHPQYAGDGEMDYGEAVIGLEYVRERWARMFELIDVSLMIEDPYQVVLTLRRR
jgi:SAM-dependent methyltransferase